MRQPLRRSDCNGTHIREGDVVRIVGVPDLDGMSIAGRRESEPVFRYLVGKYKRIDRFNEHGLAEIWFRLPSDQRRLHLVAIEPWLLRKRQARKALDR